MNHKIKIICSIILIGIVMLLSSNVNAAPVAISSSKATVEAGESFTITVSSDYIGRIDVSATGGNVEFANGKNRVWVEKNSDTITVTAKEAGTYTFTATPAELSDGTQDIENIASQSTTVKVGSQNNSTSSQTTTTNQTQTTKTQSEPEAKFTDINKTMYSTGDVNVRSSYSTSSKAVGSLREGDTVTVIGTSTNGWSKVKFNGQTAYVKTSLLTDKKPEKKSNNNFLKSLKIDGVSLNPEFNKETTEYKVTVGKDVESLKIDARSRG